MKATKRMGALFSATLAAALMAGCGRNDLASGGGDATETGNARVAGQLVLENGHAAAGADVVILPSDYDPVRGPAIPDSQRVAADAEGRFHFTRLDSGHYNIQVKHALSRTRLLITGITVALNKVRISQDTLHAPGSLSVPIPETGDSGVGYVYLPGTTIRGRVDSEIRIAGKIEIDSVPAAIIPSVVYTKGDTGSPILVLAGNVQVNPGELALAPPFYAWSYAEKLALNTSASGVPIGKDLKGFPMLVRLAAPEFDFSQAQAGGADLRFAKADGTPLAREIEAWDAKAGHAEIWVRMDTVRAGDASQFITMHWGNPKAGAPVFRPPVFDTAAGFSGVWHLGEEAPDTAANGLYRDATGFADNGNDRVTSTLVDGVIAGGHGFDSADYIEAPITHPSAANPDAFTISVWYRSKGDHDGPTGGEMLSMGDNFGLRVVAGGYLHLFFWPPTPPAGLTTPWWAIEVKRPETFDGNWHLAAGVFDGGFLRLYLDGKEIGNMPAVGPVAYAFPLNATLGKHGNLKQGYEYSGDLDEAQIHSVARSPDWLNLSYQNQKPGASFPAVAK